MINMTPKQAETVRAIKDGYRYILTGGAISTAKTYGMAFIFLSLAVQYPKTRYAISRLNLSTIKRTTLQSFREVAFKMGILDMYEENLAEMCWSFNNGSQIWFVELDHTKDRDFNKLKGLELTAGGIDEANEVLEEAFMVFSSRVGRKNENNEPQFVLLTCNPTDNWIKHLFYDKFIKNELEMPYKFIPSLPSDNPFNSAKYLEALNQMPENFKRRYVEGRWDYKDDLDSLFKYRFFDMAIKNELSEDDINKLRTIGYDVARGGTDRSVASIWYGKTLVDIVIVKDKHDQMTTDVQALELIRIANQNGVIFENVAVDAVGVGVGVVDHARSKGIEFKEFVSGARAVQLPEERDNNLPSRYSDLRSQVIYEFSLGLERGEIKIYHGCPFRNELISEAMLHQHESDGKRLKVESKDEIKKRTGGISPDILDAVVMGLYPQLSIDIHNDEDRIIF